jgi:hypothetical protein
LVIVLLFLLLSCTVIMDGPQVFITTVPGGNSTLVPPMMHGIYAQRAANTGAGTDPIV